MLAIVSLFTFSPRSVSLKLSDMRTVFESLSPVTKRRPFEPEMNISIYKFVIFQIDSFLSPGVMLLKFKVLSRKYSPRLM